MVGVYAEWAVVPQDVLVPVPDQLPSRAAAAVLLQGMTAHAMTHDVHQGAPGEWALVHAAAGGVGIAAIQIAKGIGAEIFGTASASKHDAIRAQGVAHPIDYRREDFEAEVMRITSGGGIDIAFDALGPTSFRKDYRLLRPGGRLIMYGLSEVQQGTRRSVPTVARSLLRMPFATLPWWKSISIMNENKGVFGLNMLHWWDRERNVERIFGPLVELLERGDLEPLVAQAFPFDRAGEAHSFIAERRNIGKVVLVP
jgi:NADPH:quinone reductase-like Zn-dependent oxidoreductase